MVIGIDGSRAFLKQRTGIEEYSYQVIKHLRDELVSDQVILYIRADQDVDFDLPANWTVEKIWAPRLWTHVRLSWEMFWHTPDALFIPAHTVPLIHPKNTVVVMHGLEYETCPKAYSWKSRLFMRWAIVFSCRVASKIICVSENTKKDVNNLYRVALEKMTVVYEGYESVRREIRKQSILNCPYVLFIGRLEERKNIIRFIEAFEIFKKENRTDHKLVLAGKGGYGYETIREKISSSVYKRDIVETGYISEEEKWSLLSGADVFLFATLYEGFGIPVLEAQSMDVSVIVSNNSSLPEVAGDGSLQVNPLDSEDIAEKLSRLLSDNALKNAIIQKGRENVKRFSWEKCAREIASILEEE